MAKARTLTDISRRSGLSLSHVSRIYSGKRWPSLRAAMRIARARGITLDRLCSELVRRQVA